jgi:hypothetical protein
MSWINFTTALLIIGYAAYLYFHGRPINRGMMIVSLLAGLWAGIMYGLFIIDQLLYDILSPDIIRNYCIKPAIFVLLCTILAWTIRSGWRDDR